MVKKTDCKHGISFSKSCDYCEITIIRRKLKELARKITKEEARLKFLEDRFADDFRIT